MPRVANPLTKVRKRLEACCFGLANFKSLPKDKDKPSKPERHLSFYRKNVPIQREIVPKVDEALDLACERLGLNRELVHGFVRPDPTINAFCRDGIRGNAVVFVNSGLVERLTVLEMAYVFGHELGHYLTPLALNTISDGQGGHVPASMEDAVIYRQLEVSMDRFGLVVCQDLNVACSAALKLQSGLSGDNIQVDLAAFGKEAIKGFVRDHKEYYNEAFASHPAVYARIRALYLFSQSDKFLALIGKKGGRPHAEVDADVQKDLHATLDYYAEKLMDDALSDLNNALAALQVDHEGQCQLAHYAVSPRTPPDQDRIRSLAGDIQKIPEKERTAAVSVKFDELVRECALRCPYRTHQHLEAVLSQLEKTKFHPIAKAIADGFAEQLVKIRST